MSPPRKQLAFPKKTLNLASIMQQVANSSVSRQLSDRSIHNNSPDWGGSPIVARTPLNSISIDVEEHYHVEAFANTASSRDHAQSHSRVRRNVDEILDLLASFRVKGTFFILGKVAETCPDVIRSIAACGHEIGCHSYAHKPIFRLSQAQFREDTRRAKAILEDLTSTPVAGYRAPSFSITKASLWAWEILAQEGFSYSSSVFPITHDIYGMPESPRFPYLVRTTNGPIIEVPLSTFQVCGRNLPVAGGGYLRILPLLYTLYGISEIHHRDKQPVVCYFHPWEIDTKQPRLQGPFRSRFRHYTGLSSMKRKLRTLLTRHTFGPISKVISTYENSVETIAAI